MLNYQNTQFIKSAASLSQLPPDVGYEVAFAGRSNAGKSSVLNVLTRQRGLAKVSKTPGRTQLINYFQVADNAHLVDLPGYGYAKVAKSMQRQWQKLLDDYLRTRESLAGIVLIMDIRHPLKPFDEMLLDWASAQAMPMHILLNKADKLSRNQTQQTLFKVKAHLDAKHETIQLFSALNKTGLPELQTHLEHWLNPA